MSLVLAIQPDGGQAARLASVCRRIGADFVLAASAAEALASLAGRVPDVVLTAPLLPASDETLLADHLRALGDGGLHVQVLAAPLLGAPGAPPQPGGVLDALRRRRRVSSPPACDPLVYAGELSGHLLRAVAERIAIMGEPIVAPPLDEAPAPAGNPEPETAAACLPVPPAPNAVAAAGPGAAGSGRTSGDPHPAPRRPRRRRRRVPDDAAYFDPERSSFAAVLEKLDEVSG